MPRQTLVDVTVVVGDDSLALDLSGNANDSSFSRMTEAVDVTAYADTHRRREGGIGDSTVTINSQNDMAEQPESLLRSLIGRGFYPGWVQSNSAMAEGDWGCFVVPGFAGELAKTGVIGEAQMLNLSGEGDGPMIFGHVAVPDVSPITGNGNGAGFEPDFGAVEDGRTVHAAMWVFSATGSLEMALESSPTGAWAGEETSQIALAGASSPGVITGSVDGPITDTHWRAAWTAASSPDFTVLVLFGKF